MEERYSAQFAVLCIGKSGQEKLKKAKVLVVGAGGLGSTALFCLAGSGCGNIHIADYDTVSLSNLNRQFLHTTKRIGTLKSESAKLALSELNPEINITAHNIKITEENAKELVRGMDVVLSAVDDFATRLILNKACVELKVALINGGVDGMNGSLQCVEAGKTACLYCLYNGINTEKTTKSTSFPPVVSTISAMMAQCALNYILTSEMPLSGSILYYDAQNMEFTRVNINKNAECTVCGHSAK